MKIYYLKADYELLKARYPILFLYYLIKNKSFRFMFIVRTMSWLWFSKYFRFLYYLLYPVYSYESFISGISMSPKMECVGGVRFSHCSNIVINSRCIIGNYVVIFNGVTLGSVRSNKKTNGAPKIGDYVVIAPGAKIIGNVKVGNYCFIGANAVVTHDVPDGSTVVGNPGIIVNNDGRRNVSYYIKII